MDLWKCWLRSGWECTMIDSKRTTPHHRAACRGGKGKCRPWEGVRTAGWRTSGFTGILRRCQHRKFFTGKWVLLPGGNKGWRESWPIGETAKREVTPRQFALNRCTYTVMDNEGRIGPGSRFHDHSKMKRVPTRRYAWSMWSYSIPKYLSVILKLLWM